MTEQRPIKVPSELLEQWRTAPEYATEYEVFTMVRMTTRRLQEIADQAAQWGWQQRDATVPQELQEAADKELDACVDWLACADAKEILRADRRPKSPSLKEQALAELEEIMTELHDETGSAFTAFNIRRALESLPEQ